MFPEPSAEEVRLQCVCVFVFVCETILHFVVLMFNGPFLSFDLSSGSKGESHLPLSAQSVWQGQEPC